MRLDVTIGKDGHVIEVESISGNPALVDAAKQAVLQWAYTPTLLNGDPIEGIIEVDVPFGRSKQAPPPRQAEGGRALARIFQCAPTGQITSGGRTHPRRLLVELGSLRASERGNRVRPPLASTTFPVSDP